MRKVALIYNPFSGQLSHKREQTIAAVIAELRSSGAEVLAIPTNSPTSATEQARTAMLAGCDTILACGGDGTVHEVLQSLVGTPEHTAVLGVIPMGTANALASDLGLPRSPVKAARKLMQATPVTINVGRVFYHDHASSQQSHYFIVAAGVGPDALFLSRLDPTLKRRFGYIIYVIEAARLWATHHFPTYAATFREFPDSTPRTELVSQLLAVRIRNFGGVLNHLVPGAALANKRLRIIAFKTRSRLRYMRFLIAVIFARHSYSSIIELVHTSSVDCDHVPPISSKPVTELSNPITDPPVRAPEKIYVEADGELLGTLPARIEVVPQAVRLLIPEALIKKSNPEPPPKK